MKSFMTTLSLAAAGCVLLAQPASQKPAATQSTEQQIIEMERHWAAAIQRQDVASMGGFLSDDYFLAIGVQGQDLKIVPRAAWLDNLKFYVTTSFKIDDVHVHVYGDTAVVLMLYSQKATIRGQDRSAQFLITDIWIKKASGWRVTERHSSRPEQPVAARP